MIVGRLNRKRSVSMKSKRILMLAQPPAEQAYWTECILNGARQRASRFEAVIVLYESAEELLKQEKQADRALVIGYSQRWFEDVTRQLLSRNVEPIFVSAYTPMDERYNAVCFSISSCVEEMIHYLRSAGRRRIAFFGYNPDSPADASKAKVFLLRQWSHSRPSDPEADFGRIQGPGGLLHIKFRRFENHAGIQYLYHQRQF